jgi:hypothetical protein
MSSEMQKRAEQNVNNALSASAGVGLQKALKASQYNEILNFFRFNPTHQ